MQTWSLPLIVATGAFLAVLLWRVRPSVPWGRRRREAREARREVQARIETASNDEERARALCDAADLAAKSVGRKARAASLYQRAIRADPRSMQIIARAVAGLAARPHALESLLWRHLAAVPWSGASRDAARASLDALHALYEDPLKSHVRARALANARDLLDARVDAGPSSSAGRPEDGRQRVPVPER
jgi:hypothetical protein